MVIQNILFPDSVCSEQEIYLRTETEVKIIDDQLCIPKDMVVKTDTYMNALDLTTWKEYTDIRDIKLALDIQGEFVLYIRNLQEDGTVETLYQQEHQIRDREKLEIEIPGHVQQGMLFWEIWSKQQTTVYGGQYTTSDTAPSNAKLAVNICTFHREEQLMQNLRKLQTSRFFQKNSEYYGKLHVFVIDNGNSLQFPAESPWIQVFANSNQGGGTGGFTRGLQEIGNLQEQNAYTHVVFMDDDVEFRLESFYRLYAFLSFLKREKRMTAVAGRMFRLDNKVVQYTAVEKWNKGDLRHVNGNLDMRQTGSVVEKQPVKGDYGGWWFCTYPAEYALSNRPFPFFIHCDDVEFGLRFSGETIALKGVQVWHQTYEYRQSPEIVYYDIRNTLIVNVLHGYGENKAEVIADWKKKLDGFYWSGNQAMKYYCVLGLYHFGKGASFYQKGGKLPKIHLKLKNKDRLLKIVVPLFHRYTTFWVQRRYEKIKQSYQKGMK